MSILIKGMEMPTRCFSCPMCDVENAEVNCAISHGSYIEYREVDPKVAIQERPSWCPIIEVPPHGRLIDADIMIKKYEPDINRRIYGGNFIFDLEHAPTVIESESYSERELQRDYEASVEYAQYCERYEPTYDPDTWAM